MEMPGRSFWVRAVGVPTGLALCAYLISVSHFAPSSIAVYLLLLFLLLVDITSRIPDRARTPFVVLAALVLGLCLIEGVALAFVHKPPISIQQKGLLAHDSILGWHNGNPGVYSDKRIDSNTGATIYNVRYTIDENRLRKTISSDHGPTVAFLGDSFTFGLGVKDADTMPQAFADLTDYKIRVLNLGVEGYSPAQFLRAMQTGVFDKIIGPKPSLFVFLTSPWQSSRVACKLDFVAGAPRYILDENGKPIFAGVCRVDHVARSGRGTRNFIHPPRVSGLPSARRSSPHEPRLATSFLFSRSAKVCLQVYSAGIDSACGILCSRI